MSGTQQVLFIVEEPASGNEILADAEVDQPIGSGESDEGSEDLLPLVIGTMPVDDDV